MLATVTGDNSDARLWQVSINRQSGPPLTATANLGHRVASAQFSPDGKILATVSPTGVIRFWDVAFPHELLRSVCAIAGQAMTRVQWNTYVSAQSFEPICSPR